MEILETVLKALTLGMPSSSMFFNCYSRSCLDILTVVIIGLVLPLDLVHGSVPNTGTMSLVVVSSSTTSFLAPSAMELQSLLQRTSLCKETASLATIHSSAPVDQVVQYQTLSLLLPHSLPRSIPQRQCLFRQFSPISAMATP